MIYSIEGQNSFIFAFFPFLNILVFYHYSENVESFSNITNKKLYFLYLSLSASLNWNNFGKFDLLYKSFISHFLIFL